MTSLKIAPDLLCCIITILFFDTEINITMQSFPTCAIMDIYSFLFALVFICKVWNGVIIKSMVVRWCDNDKRMV